MASSTLLKLFNAAVTAAMNEMFRQRTAKEVLAQCVAAALAGKGGGGLTLPAVEAKLRALQAEQLDLLQLAMRDLNGTEYDERLAQINDAMSGLLTRKNELIQTGCTDTEYDSRVQTIAAALETTDSAIAGFNDGMVFQTVSSIKVLDRDRLSVRFKDGTELEQTVEHTERRASA